MRRAISYVRLIFFPAIALAGCGGLSSSLAPSGTNTTQVSLTVHDNPLLGVTVLSFEIDVTGAALQPTDSNSQSVSLPSEPEEIELEHLQTESALLSSKSVPVGSYRLEAIGKRIIPSSPARIAVVTGDSPVEQDVFHFGAGADIVDDHVAAGCRRFAVDDHADVRDVSAQVPSDNVAGRVILRP